MWQNSHTKHAHRPITRVHRSKGILMSQGSTVYPNTINDCTINFDALSDDIKRLFDQYVAIPCTTKSGKEPLAQQFFLDCFRELPYFKTHPTMLGTFPLPNDALKRNACWAMVQGSGNNTVVMLHHYDMVNMEAYKSLAPYACSPEDLKQQLNLHPELIDIRAQQDLASGDFIFGRGTCDMKAGGAIQIALMRQYSRMSDFHGNVILLAVPDEENLSAGMMAADVLLDQLRQRFSLHYRLAIDSEPHQRKDPSHAVISLGSIGKMLAFVHVRGALTHAGKIFDGLNPWGIMSRIIAATEINMDYADSTDVIDNARITSTPIGTSTINNIHAANTAIDTNAIDSVHATSTASIADSVSNDTSIDRNECTPAPTWLHVQDSKTSYDVSVPIDTYGCLSLLTFSNNQQQLLDKLDDACTTSFADAIATAQHSFDCFNQSMHQPATKLPWEPCVVTFGELYRQVCSDDHQDVQHGYNTLLNTVGAQVKNGQIEATAGSEQLVSFLLDHRAEQTPIVVYGLIPPYYPPVSCKAFKNDTAIATLFDDLNAYATHQLGQPFDKEYFFDGLSDLSYTSLTDAQSVEQSLRDTMPLFEHGYNIPLYEIEHIAMPCVNIGPWGLDLHRISERVYTKDLLVTTPHILDHVVRKILQQS